MQLRLLSERPAFLLRSVVFPWLAQALDLGKAKVMLIYDSFPDTNVYIDQSTTKYRHHFLGCSSPSMKYVVLSLALK